MSDVLDPDAVKARTFTTARRGFERAEVEAFQAEMADHIGELQQRLATMDDRLSQLGITDLPDLKAEIGWIAFHVESWSDS